MISKIERAAWKDSMEKIQRHLENVESWYLEASGWTKVDSDENPLEWSTKNHPKYEGMKERVMEQKQALEMQEVFDKGETECT